MSNYELVIIGGGASGMLTAIRCKQQGINSILVIEKDPVLGGALVSGDYNIFSSINKTGKEYLKELKVQFEQASINTLVNTMAISINDNMEILCTSPENGVQMIKADTIVIANGGKEKGRNAVNMPGDRVSGTYSIGTAKKILSDAKLSLGNHIVLYGVQHLDSIASVMESCGVKIDAVINPQNKAFSFAPAKDATVYNGYDLIQITGEGRITHITVKDDIESKTIPCDTLLFAHGWLADGLVAMRSNINLNPETTGPDVDQHFMTSRDHIYAVGNGICIHNSMDEIIDEVDVLANILSLNH